MLGPALRTVLSAPTFIGHLRALIFTEIPGEKRAMTGTNIPRIGTSSPSLGTRGYSKPGTAPIQASAVPGLRTSTPALPRFRLWSGSAGRWIDCLECIYQNDTIQA